MELTDEVNRRPSELLKKSGFKFKKKWGQNFIYDKNLLNRIAQAGDIKPDETVLEIGPGAGTLTKIMAEMGAKVLAVEIDEELIPILKENLKGYDVHIVRGDILKTDVEVLIEKCKLTKPYKIIANLPYYITTPILMHILENNYQFNKMVIMVQLEVAERLSAQPGAKEYGSLTLAVNYYTSAKLLFKVPRHIFNPVPDVDSAIVVLEKYNKPPVDVYNSSLMFKIIKAAFGQRRKTLLNALTTVNKEVKKEEILEIFEKANVDSRRRGETLSLSEFANIANTWYVSTKTNQ